MPKKKSKDSSKKSKKSKKDKKENLCPIHLKIRSLIEDNSEHYTREEILEEIESLLERTIPRASAPPKNDLVKSIVDDLVNSVDDCLEYDLSVEFREVELVDAGFNDIEVKKIVKEKVKRWLNTDKRQWEGYGHTPEIRKLMEKVQNSAGSIFTKDDYIILLQELAGLSEETDKNPQVDERSIIDELSDAITSAPISVSGFEMFAYGTELKISNIEIDREELEEEIESVLNDASERGYF